MTAEMPISKELFSALVVYLSDINIYERCDARTLFYTTRFLKNHRLNKAEINEICDFLRSKGGYCDCEVLLNVLPAVLPDKNEFLEYAKKAKAEFDKKRAESVILSKMPRLIRISVGGQKYIALRKAVVTYLRKITVKSTNDLREHLAQANGWTPKQAGESKPVQDFMARQKESIRNLKLSWSENPTMVMTYDDRNGWFIPLTPEWEKKARNTQFQADFLVGVDNWDNIEERSGYMVARDNTVTDGRPYYLASFKTLQRKDKVMEHGVTTPQEAWDALEAYFKDRQDREEKARKDAALWLADNPEAKAEILALKNNRPLYKIEQIVIAHGGLPEGVRPKHIRIALTK